MICAWAVKSVMSCHVVLWQTETFVSRKLYIPLYTRIGFIILFFSFNVIAFFFHTHPHLYLSIITPFPVFAYSMKPLGARLRDDHTPVQDSICQLVLALGRPDHIDICSILRMFSAVITTQTGATSYTYNQAIDAQDKISIWPLVSDS